MGRPSTHNWPLLYKEFCLSKCDTIAEWAKQKHMNPNQVRDEFKKLNGVRKQIEEKISAEPAHPAGRPKAPRTENRTENRKQKNEQTDNSQITENDDTDVADRFTNRQLLFVVYYLTYFSPKHAAIKAGFSEHMADKIGWELLQKPHIKKEIQQRTKVLLDNLGVTPQRVLMEYLKIAFADIGEYVEFGQREIPATGRGKKGLKKRTVNYVDLNSSSKVDTSLISEISEGKDGIKVKLHDKMKALEKIDKYFDLLPDNWKRMVDEERLAIEQQRLAIERERLEIEKKKSLGDNGAAETAHNERVTTLAQLINHPEPDRCIEDFEEEEEGEPE